VLQKKEPRKKHLLQSFHKNGKKKTASKGRKMIAEDNAVKKKAHTLVEKNLGARGRLGLPAEARWAPN